MSSRKLAFALFTAAIVVCLTVGLAEIVLRAAGYQPWSYLGLDAHEPVMHMPDPTLGWRMKPGIYLVPAYTPGEKDISVSILSDGTRATRPGRRPCDMDVALIGGSITHGWGVSNEETFAWKVQDRFPGLCVANYGTGGYGTYQSLLMLEELYAEGRDPNVVVYGFIDHHEVRNVAPVDHLYGLASFSRRGHVNVPYCTLDQGGGLQRHPPQAYPAWPLRQRLASVAFLEWAYMRLLTRERASQGRAVTEPLLIEMAELCKRHGSRFLVILLSSPDEARTHYLQFLKRHGIASVDCVRPLTPELLVPGEGHPNASVHETWSGCIAKALGELPEQSSR